MSYKKRNLLKQLEEAADECVAQQGIPGKDYRRVSSDEYLKVLPDGAALIIREAHSGFGGGCILTHNPNVINYLSGVSQLYAP